MATVKIEPLTSALVNAALAMYEAEDHDGDDDYDQGVMDRTRAKVHDAMGRAAVTP